jgi:tetratricopeptide (TPR) repeat protein
LAKHRVRLAKETNDDRIAAVTRQTLAIALLYDREYPRATALLTESQAVFRRFGYRDMEAASSNGLAVIAHRLGDHRRAVDLVRDALRLYQLTSNRLGLCGCFETLAIVAEARGQPERAARLFGAAEALRTALGAPMPPIERPDYEQSIATLRSALSNEVLATAWAAGRDTMLEDVTAYALSDA